MRIAVAVPRPLAHPFTYEIAPELGRVEPGSWVTIPFGRGNSPIQGYVVGVDVPDPGQPLKTVTAIGRPEESIPPDVFSLCSWASRYYHAPWGEILRLALPRQLLGKEEKPRAPRPASVPREVVLTDEQRAAVSAIMESHPGRCTLLQGATGSGKTLVYIEIARQMLERGQSVLILVPEIALTPQLHARLEEGLGREVALWHSAQPDGKRRSLWHSLRRGELRVAVGARSAVFLPLEKLGLIILDEEHDSSFKQEDRVRYNARDLALVRAQLTGARAVLGSATPSLETLVRVKQEKYSVSHLTKRFSGHTPVIDRVDLAEEELVDGLKTPLAVRTLQEIRETVGRGEQVMVFLNRRGYASFIICQDCRESPECPNCSVSLTVHHRPHRLVCHLCCHQSPIPKACPDCQSLELIELGSGTEALEEELGALLPDTRILRLDRDTITSNTRLVETLDAFREGKASVLVGTQMLAKGHDFPNVTLVVVVLADGLFRIPDFRCRERAVQMLLQVSGRAARGALPGRVLIQTYDPDHPVLRVLSGEDTLEDFQASELETRTLTGFPPASRLARLRFTARTQDEAWKLAEQVAQGLAIADDNGLRVLGPTDAAISRLKNIYRVDLLIKAPDIQTLQAAVHRGIGLSEPNRQGLIVDLDPSGLG